MGRLRASQLIAWTNLAPGPALLVLGCALGLAQSSLDEDFKAGTLDYTTWCPCQINMRDSPYTFTVDPDDANDRVLSIPVDDHSLGGNQCRRKAPDYECEHPGTLAKLNVSAQKSKSNDSKVIEELGPSFFAARQLGAAGVARVRNPYCTDAVLKRALAAKEEGECFERQELRLQEDKAPPSGERYVYELRFRMPAKVKDQTHSIRWVIAQWKQEPVAKKYGEEFGAKWGPSPFLAQRYDDGVLHVTVQDEHCRCLVASAPHPNGRTFDWTSGPAKECKSTHPANEGAACSSTLQLKFADNPVLESPAGRFVDMKYIVQAGRESGSQIDIFQDGRFIVSVSGKIGYDVDPSAKPVAKFKIGHYRDYMPFDYVMDIDSIKIGKEGSGP
jgi:hypothetical protein